MKFPDAGRGGTAVALTLLTGLPWLAAGLPPFAEAAGTWREVWNPTTVGLLGSSFRLALGVAALALGIGIPLAVLALLSRPSWPRTALLVAVAFGFVLSPVVYLAAWKTFALDRLCPPWTAALWVLAGHYAPLAMFASLLGFASLDRAALEAGLLAFLPRTVAWRIAAPPLGGLWLATGGVIGLAAFAETEVPGLLRYPVYGEEILARLSIDNSPAAALVLAWLPVGFLVLAAPWLWRTGQPLLDRMRHPLDWVRDHAAPPWPAIATGAAVIGALGFGLPVLALAAMARFAELPNHAPALAFSMGLAAVSGLFGTGLAHLLVDGLEDAPSWVRHGVFAAFAIQIPLPGALLGLGLIELGQGLGGWGQGVAWLALAHGLRILPWLVLLLAVLREQTGLRRQEAHRLLPMPWWNRQRFLVVPQLWPALLGCWALGTSLALAELPTTILVAPPGAETAILRLYNLIHYGDWGSVATLSLSLGGVVLAGVGAASWLGATQYDRNRRTGI